MDLELDGKRALVTGSSSGIGEGIAQLLAAEGCKVVVHGRNETRGRKVVEAICEKGGKASLAIGDLATEAGCAAVAEMVLDETGGIDILINNAGGRASSHRTDGQAGPANPAWLDIPWSDWAWTYEQNVGAAVRLIQAFVPGMKDRGWGRVINIASAAATQTEPDIGEYAAAKAALVNLTSSLARTLAHTGITVNCVSPGAIATPALRESFTDLAKQLGWNWQDWDEIEYRMTREIIPIAADRFGQPDDIGRMVALLASPLSHYMTGANHRVDGGQCRSIN